MASKNQTIKVGISVGDVNGIGIEVILKSLQDKNMLDFFTPVIFGSVPLLQAQGKKLGLDNVPLNGIKNLSEVRPKKINVLNIWNKPIAVDFGKATPEAGKLAIDSFVKATDALKNGEIDVLVTAPINKDNIQSSDYQHPGHTEYLGTAFDQDALMVLTGDKLTVALVTQHIPISQVSSEISKEKIIDKARAFYTSLKEDFYITRPKLAILGLNPHAGDNGIIGKEEMEIINPAIEELKKENLLVFGPYPADSFFIPKVYEQFDGVLAMYHDQGLIPFKSIHFQDGVNFTAGLDKIRTSPDHGVAYDIAGQGIADETSFKEAIFKAIEIFNNRSQDKEDRMNPLEISEETARSKKPSMND